MKWIRYDRDGTPAYGIVEGDTIVEVEGTPFGETRKTGARRPLAGVKYLLPFVPGTFYAAGLNYAGHLIARANAAGEVPKLPKQADIGYRGNGSLIAHEETIVIPADATEAVQYEAEVVVVIGRKARNLSREDALSCVLGYTIGNDLSERTWQKQDRTNWRAKNSDTFAPMGPFLVTDFDIGAAETVVRVNGREGIRFPTNSMVFGVPEYISRISQYITLHPGDMIWMGTEGKGEDLKAGDVIEIDITGLGTLRNPVTRAGG